MGIDLSPDTSAKAIPYGNNGGNKLKCERDMRGGRVRGGEEGQAVRHCGKVGGQSDDLAPAMDSLGVYTAGHVHGR